MLVVYFLGWCWLPCIQTYPLYSSHLMHRLHKHLHALHHTGSQTENPVVIPEEPEEQFEVQPQEVPEADEEDVEELPECPDHRPSSFERGKPRSISPGLQLLVKCFILINALRSGVVCNRCCIIPCLPLLYYILVTLVSAVESMLSWLRPVEVGWFPVTCEL